MTDRLKGCTVVFEKNMRVDDAEALLNAIRHIRGVELVEPVISGPSDWMAERRAKSQFIEDLYKWIDEQSKK